MKVAVFALYSFWVPQIVLCVRTDARQPLRPAYVVGMSAARLALPLYLYGCPKNLLRVAPSPAVCAGLVAFVGLQAAVLLAQERWGPRCFVPKVRRAAPPCSRRPACTQRHCRACAPVLPRAAPWWAAFLQCQRSAPAPAGQSGAVPLAWRALTSPPSIVPAEVPAAQI